MGFYCNRMKYNGCDKNLTEKCQLLNYMDVMTVSTTAIYSFPQLMFTVEMGGGGKQFHTANLDLLGY